MARLDAAGLPARIVLVCALSLFIIFGIRLSFSVFFAEFVLVEGWSNEAAAAIFSVNMLVFAVTAPLAGMALDRFGPRPVFGVGALLMAAGLWLSSLATSLPALFFAYGCVVGCGLGITGLGPIASVVAGWTPPQQRGRAIGIAFAGTGLGSLIFVPLSNWLIALLDWRGAYLTLALVCLFLLLPLMTLGLNRPPAPASGGGSPASPKLARRALLRQPRFWALLLVGLLALGPLRSLTVHHIAIMQAAGVQRQAAANVVGLAGLLTCASFIALGWLSDRFGRAQAFTLGALALLGAVGVLMRLPAAGSAALLLAYALLYALGESARSSQATALASDLFPRGGLGFINGLMGGMFGIGAALGPWLVGRLRDQSGSYAGGFALIAAMVLVSLFAFWFAARPRPAKDSDRQAK